MTVNLISLYTKKTPGIEEFTSKSNFVSALILGTVIIKILVVEFIATQDGAVDESHPLIVRACTP